MTIRDLCSRQVLTIDAGASPADAARLMQRHHVGALVVTAGQAEGQSVRGVITDRDLVVQVLARGAGDDAGTLGALASAPPVSVSEDADVAQALALMASHGVRRLLVADDAAHLTGLLSLDDLLPALAQPFAELTGVMRAGAAREAAARPAVAAPPLPRVRVPAMGTAGWRPRGLR